MAFGRIGKCVAGRRIGTGNQKARLGELFDDQRQHETGEPFERHLIRRVPETAEEQHRAGFARAAGKRIRAGIDSRAHSGVDLAARAWGRKLSR